MEIRKGFSRKKRENGSALVFFVMFVLPVLSFLLMVSFEVAQIYVKKRKMQDVLDDAALIAVRFFPYKEQMEQVATNYIQSNARGGQFNIDVGNQGVSIEYRLPVKLIFSQMASFFMRNSADEEYPTWDIRVFTMASPQVEDYMILLDRSKNVAPNDETDLWGDEANWPPSNIINVQNANGSIINDRYFTQQCFNPVFNELKKAAISLYNYFGNFSLNQVGFMVAPGGGAERQVDFLLPIGAVNLNLPNSNLTYLDYENPGNPTQEDCYNIAKKDTKYFFAKNSDDSDFYVTKIQDQNNDFDNNTSFQNAIWSIPAHQGFMYNFSKVLEQALNQLIATQNLRQRNQASEDITKTLIFITSKLPNVNNNDIQVSVNNTCNLIGDVDINLNVLYALNDTQYVENDEREIKNFNNFLNNLSQNTCINFSLIVTDKNKNEDIGDGIFEYLQINQRRGHLWR